MPNFITEPLKFGDFLPALIAGLVATIGYFIQHQNNKKNLEQQAKIFAQTVENNQRDLLKKMQLEVNQYKTQKTIDRLQSTLFDAYNLLDKINSFKPNEIKKRNEYLSSFLSSIVAYGDETAIKITIRMMREFYRKTYINEKAEELWIERRLRKITTSGGILKATEKEKKEVLNKSKDAISSYYTMLLLGMLCTSLKYQITDIYVSPDTYMQMKLNDIEEYIDIMKIIASDAVKGLDLPNEYLI